VGDLHKSVQVSEEAMKPELDINPVRSLIRSNLAKCLLERVKHFGSIDDIDRAVECNQQSLNLSRDDRSIDYSMTLGNHGCMLHQRFLQNDSIDDLDSAIRCTETALKILRETHQLSSVRQLYQSFQYNAGSYFRQRYSKTKDVEDLSRAIINLEEVVISKPPISIYAANVRVDLAGCLSQMYDVEQSCGSLEGGAMIITQAILAVPEDYTHPMYVESTRIATELGTKLALLYEETGDIRHLNTAIELGDMSVRRVSIHPDGPRHLRELASLVAGRYHRTGQRSDLEHAATLAQAALDSSPAGTLEHADACATLGKIYDSQFRHTQDFADLDKAINYYQASLDNTPGTNLEVIAHRIWSISTCSLLRYKNHDREMEELDRAIQLMNTGIQSLPSKNQSRSRLMFNLACYLDRKYELCQTEEYAAHAVECWKQNLLVLEEINPRHVERSKCWYRLGRTYLAQSSHNPKLIDAAITAFEQCGGCNGGLFYIRIAALVAAASEYAKRGDENSLERGLLCVQQAIELYPVTSLRGVGDLDRLGLIEDVMSVGHLGAAISVLLGRSPYESLKIMEMGRGILASSLMEVRADVSDLKEKHPKLASELMSIQVALDDTPQQGDLKTLQYGHARISRENS
jgi:tetratricopeptide (TPR) repeat protein